VEDLCPPERETISVIVADADPLTNALLAALLGTHPDFQVLAAVCDQDSLLRKVHQGGADVALVGLDLADGPSSGLAALKAVRELDPALRVILLLNRTEPQLLLDAIRAGSRGVFSRSEFEPAALFKCIRCVGEGQFWLNTRELEWVLSAWSRTPQFRVVDALGARLLSNREEEVVQLVVEGLSNREIAQRLTLSEHTVRNYLFKVFDKLGVSNRVELVLYATSHSPRRATPLPVRAELRPIPGTESVG
jgi:DNA-binding NarL/FixJ family response regulator